MSISESELRQVLNSSDQEVKAVLDMGRRLSKRIRSNVGSQSISEDLRKASLDRLVLLHYVDNELVRELCRREREQS